MDATQTASSAAAEAVLAGLDPEQRAAAEAVRGPVCILAGAGTGKTRAITHRIAYAVRTGAVPASQLLAVTFTARAAGELRSRLRALGAPGVQARTFHATALRQLQYFAPRVLGGGMPEITDNTLRIVGNAAARLRLRVDRTELRDLAAEIDWAKAVLAAPEDYAAHAAAAGRETSKPPATVAELYAEYEQTKKRAGRIDFSDLLLIMAGAIDSMPDVAEEIRRRYRHFVVDEYQDVSPLQQRLLDGWLGDRTDLCVVGDANQTIYSFAGATPQHLLGFRRRFPDAVVVTLYRDYRSTPQVVRLANALVQGGEARLALAGQRPDGPEPTFAEFDDEPAEAADVAARCRALVEAGTPAAEIAVLFRVNAQSEVYEKALTDAAVPYVLRGGERFFDRAEIREARLLLRGAARSGSSEAGESLPDAVRGVLGSLGWYPDNPPPGGAARERWESLSALVTLADDVLAAAPGAHLSSSWPSSISAPTPSTRRRSRASRSRRCTRPRASSGTPCSSSGSPTPRCRSSTPPRPSSSPRSGGCSTSASPAPVSTWPCPGRWPAARASAATAGRAGSSTGCAPTRRVRPRPRRSRSRPEAADAELFGRLREWRRAQAAAQAVPPYVVFSDATLVAIADARPKSRAALAQISGVGPTKLTRYSEPLLAVLGGAEPASVQPVDVS